jgi:endothelin-converting enzyme/putative endopeptidase
MIVFGVLNQTTSSKEPGINVSFFDNTVKPADNSIRKWNLLDKTEIPVIELQSFNELFKTDALDILKEASKPNV